MDPEPSLAIYETVVTEAPAQQAESAVSWAAIIAGAVVALALSFILLGLGAGFGMRLVSPWPSSYASAAAFTTKIGIWLIVVQVLADGMGGYVAGRLRTKWLNVHTHEVHFRDTAHGFLVWALSTVIGVLLAANALKDTEDRTVSAAPFAAERSATNPYLNDLALALDRRRTSNAVVNKLFRGEQNPPDLLARAAAGDIIVASVPAMAVSTDDKDYLVQLVQTRTGLTSEQARARIDAALDTAKANFAADQERWRQRAERDGKIAAQFSLFMAIALLLGAFIASVAAAIGGMRRDEMHERYWTERRQVGADGVQE